MPSLALEVDFLQRSVRVDGVAVDLTAIEFDILAALAREPGAIVSRAALLARACGPGFVGDQDLVDLHVDNLRQRLGEAVDGGIRIEPVGDSGYRLASIE